MVYKCAAINCRSDYRGEKQDQKVTFHSFSLEDKHFFQTWLKRLTRKDYAPTKLCSLDFKFEDFVTDTTDQKDGEKKKRSGNFNKKATKKRCMPLDFQGFAILLYSQQLFSPLRTFNIFFTF